jgi:ribonuclease P/MRP protein subunit POP1
MPVIHEAHQLSVKMQASSPVLALASLASCFAFRPIKFTRNSISLVLHLDIFTSTLYLLTTFFPPSSTMASKPPTTGKRKHPLPSTAAHNASRKRAKTHDARSIAVQSSDAALSKTGELDVAAFVQAREYEIKALEESMARSKKALSTRAFQQVPRSMRRRTASHNVQKVPKRLQARAKKEMKEDNTPTVNSRTREKTGKMRLRVDVAKRVIARNKRSKEKKTKTKEKENQTDPEKMVSTDSGRRPSKLKKNTLSDPPKATSKFKKRQKEKTWLPTHLYHAKRAHMTPPNEPLWRFAIPITPTEKSYRPIHRASTAKGAVAWDGSYMATIGLEGIEKSLQGVLSELGFGGNDAGGLIGKKWRNGTRIWDGWMFERDNEKSAIAPVVVIWCARIKEVDVDMPDADAAPKKEPKRSMFIRVHPSAFLQVWNETLKVAKMQRPKVMVEDLRYEIGSIEISGPGSTEALIAALRPVLSKDQASAEMTPETTWTSLAGLTNSASLPSNALFSFDISDPRLHHPPRTVKLPATEAEFQNLAELLSSWPPDNTQQPPSIFDRNNRLKATRDLRSQKFINRRKSEAAPGEDLPHLPNDPHIPVLLFATRYSPNNTQGTWTALLPWKCVLPFWYSLMHYPLSTGGNPRFGGLREKQQIAFEANEPWFPGDFPGTAAGMEWEALERERKKKEWLRKPKGRRVEYDSLDLGNEENGEIGRGWACDWERLLGGKSSLSARSDNASNSEAAIDVDATPMDNREPQATSSTAAKPPETVPAPPESKTTSTTDPARSLKPTFFSSQTFYSLISIVSTASSDPIPSIPATAVVTINITLPRGTPLPGARIYRLPSNSTHHSQWLHLLPSSRRRDNHGVTLPEPISSSPCQTTSADRQTQSQTEVPTLLNAPNTSPSTLSTLASTLLSTPQPQPPRPSDDGITYPLCPPACDLIGFVTSGSFNLKEGKGTAIGSVVVAKTLEALREEWGSEDGRKNARSRKLVIVRNAGETVGRIGWWEVV